VAADGHQVDLPVGDVDGNLTDGLSGVGVEEDSFRATDLTCGQTEDQSIALIGGYSQASYTWLKLSQGYTNKMN